MKPPRIVALAVGMFALGFGGTCLLINILMSRDWWLGIIMTLIGTLLLLLYWDNMATERKNRP